MDKEYFDYLENGKKIKEAKALNEIELENIITQFLNQALPTINGYWFTTKKAIENSDIPDWKYPDLDYYHIFNNIKPQNIIESLSIDFSPFFDSKELYGVRFDSNRISNIIHAWLNKTKILPPILYINDSNELYLSDGKHRVNTSFHLNIKKMPILVSYNDLVNPTHPFIKQILKNEK